MEGNRYSKRKAYTDYLTQVLSNKINYKLIMVTKTIFVFLLIFRIDLKAFSVAAYNILSQTISLDFL